MLHPKNNRIDYGEQLIPPDGYELAEAVGTTYSLDLETLMVLPVALFYSQLIDETYDNLRFDMLESITRAAGKITVYYQNGQLKVPHKYHYLMAYWENGIVPVTMPNHVSSFHPKVWLIRYEAKGKPAKYRILITSRNMTNCRDWDVAFSSDGIVQDKEETRSKPLADFLIYLNNRKRKISDKFISEIQFVKFDIPLPFDRMKFLPVGIPEGSGAGTYANVLTSSKKECDEMLIISPFLDNSTLEKLANRALKKPWLLSRQAELDCIEEEVVSRFSCWQFSDAIERGEHDQSLEENVVPMDQNLHAKLFITQNEDSSAWFLGSANCTDPAQGRNIEFLVQLQGTSVGLGPKQIFRMLTSDKSNETPIFIPYSRDNRVSAEEQRRIDLEVRKIKYDLSFLEIMGKAILVAGGTAYDLEIEIDLRGVDVPQAYQIWMKPLPERNRTHAILQQKHLNTIHDFTGYPETLLSPFLEFEIRRGDVCCSSFLLEMTVELPATRFNKIFSSIIDSRDKFLKYLSFLLTGEDAELVNDMNTGSMKSLSGEAASPFAGMPVYEKMLVAASRFPSRLESIDHLVERLKAETAGSEESIISSEFESFWEVFRTYVKSKHSDEGED